MFLEEVGGKKRAHRGTDTVRNKNVVHPFKWRCGEVRDAARFVTEIVHELLRISILDTIDDLWYGWIQELGVGGQ
jgi:hypothetical protein